MDAVDQETKGRQVIVDFPRQRSKRLHQDTHRTRTQEDVEETQEYRLVPTHEVETGENVVGQKDEEVGPSSPCRQASNKNGYMKNVEKVQQPTY